ncbi:MAG: alpha/beta hydrolase [Proteobacteria bacterium]|nr:alpha/beta hydrolase [Pseudomonadota bacterium]
MGRTLKIAGVLLALLVIAAGVGWSMLRRPDIPYATLEQRYGDARSHYVDLPGGFHAHYRDQGNPKGPTLLLLHGFYVSLDTWDPWVQRLSKDFRIVTVDLPGHGLTRAPKGYKPNLESLVRFVEAFARAKQLDRFVLGGSSMGGDVAWRYALAHPERLKGLVLVGAAGWPDPRPGHREPTDFLKVMGNPALRFLLRDLDTSSQAREGMRATYFAPDRFVTDAMVTRYVELSRAPGHRDAFIDMAISFDHDFATPERLAALKTPTLILSGAQDQIVPPASAGRFASSIAGSRLILYPNTGHLAQEEAAGPTAERVHAFVMGLEPKKAPPPPHKDAATSRSPNSVVFY